jgi:PEP-CTERM motif
MSKRFLMVTAAAAVALTATSANAQVVVLKFEGIATSYPHANNILIKDFYNGGTASNGNSGTNFGAGFSDNALLLCLNTVGVNCSNTSRGGLGDPTSQQGGLFFLTGAQTFLNYAAGFTAGFSFNYSAISRGGAVNVYDGLNGTGNILGTLNLGTTTSNCPGFNAGFCPFVAAGVNFAGTARSIGFGGVANQIVFDDITFGSATPGGIPEPATWAFMILGFGLVGGAMRSARRQTVRVTYA